MKTRVVIIFILCFLVAMVSFAQHAYSARVAGARYPGLQLEKERQDGPEYTLLKSMNAAAQAKIIALDSLEPETLHTLLSAESSREIIGVPRNIEVLKEQRGGQWNKLPQGGHTSTFIFTSSGAAALRIGISIDNLPSLAELRFFEGKLANDAAEVVVKGREINKLIRLNRESEPDNEYSDVYWSPVIEGESLGIEIYIPQDVEPDDVRITFSTLSHLAVSPFSSNDNQFIEQGYGDSSACQNDATCYPAWLNMSKAVAKMVYTDSGDTYTCTGTLLNDADPTTWKPYFISANHCIASQTVASTLQTYWFFESSTCDGGIRNTNYTTRNGGATLLWTEGTTIHNIDSNQDASLFQLRDMPPAGAYYAGWSDDSIDAGELVGIHHPMGDWKKISVGDYDEGYKCYILFSGGFDCKSSGTGGFLGVNWRDGGTEIGSSGSGIFNNSDELVGVLKGGNGGCDADGFSVYSKFSAAYSAGNLGQWLNTAPASEKEMTIAPILMLLLNQ